MKVLCLTTVLCILSVGYSLPFPQSEIEDAPPVNVSELPKTEEPAVANSEKSPTTAAPVSEAPAPKVGQASQNVPVTVKKTQTKDADVKPGEYDPSDPVIKSWGPNDYEFAYKTDNQREAKSIHVEKIEGKPQGKSLGDENEYDVTAKGSFSSFMADGYEYTVEYIADAQGYRPKVSVRKV